MLVHTVMWTLKDGYLGMSKLELADEIRRKLLHLKNEIAEIKFIEVGLNNYFPEKNHDVVLITKFENLDALKQYSEHPKHQEVVSFIKEVITGRAAVDYEI